MNVHRFRDLSESINADPQRRANMERHRADAVAEILSYHLTELRRLRACTQLELAEAMGIAQPTLSRVEHGEDPHLSTLRAYVEALGGRVEITAVFGDERFLLVTG